MRPKMQGGQRTQGLMQMFTKYSFHLMKSFRWVTCRMPRSNTPQKLSDSPSTTMAASSPYPSRLLRVQAQMKKSEKTKICMSFCRYHPQAMHIFSPLSTRLSTNSSVFQAPEQQGTCPNVMFSFHSGPPLEWMQTEQYSRMTTMQDGQNLSTRCSTANGYLRILLDFSRMKEQATRKPPMKKKTSTARNAPVTKRQKNFSTWLGMPEMLTSYLRRTENWWPKMTHSMQMVLMPLKILRQFDLQTKIFIDSVMLKHCSTFYSPAYFSFFRRHAKNTDNTERQSRMVRKVTVKQNQGNFSNVQS